MKKRFWTSFEKLENRVVAALLHRFKIQQKIQLFYDSWICTPDPLVKQSLQKKFKKPLPEI